MNEDDVKSEIDYYINRLNNELNLTKRRYIPDKLAKFGDWKSTKPICLILINKKTPLIIRNECAEALGKLGDPRAISYLASILQENHPELKRTAIWSLGQIGTPETLNIVSSMKTSPDIQIRKWVAKSLGRIQHPHCIKTLSEFYEELQSDDYTIKAEILRAITKQVYYIKPEDIVNWIDTAQSILVSNVPRSNKDAAIKLIIAIYSNGLEPNENFLLDYYLRSVQ